MSSLPPPLLERLLAWAYRSDPSNASILGDLREDYATLAQVRGVARARRWYRREAVLLTAGRFLHHPILVSTGRTFMNESFLSALREDTVYALRSLRRSPGFALFTALVIGLGVGATTAVFSVLEPFVLAPLPFAGADELVWISNAPPQGATSQSAFTSRTSNLRDFRAQARSFEGITGYNAFFEQGAYSLTGDGEPERLVGVGVAHDFLDVLGVEPALGRGFTEEEGLWVGPPAVVLSHGFWVRRFGSDPDLVGGAITLNDTPFTVAGVLPASFDFSSIFTPGVPVDFLLTFAVSDETDRWGNTMFFIGRLRPGATATSAQSELDAIIVGLEEAQPDRWGLGARVTPLRDKISAPFSSALALLGAAAATLLLIVCVNVTNLLLARSPGRAREVAVRKAFGAPRGRVVRQLMVETLVISLGGAAVGAVLAWIAVRLVSGAAGLAIPFIDHLSLNGSALLFATAVAVVTGLLVGLIPALQVADGGEAGVLRAGGRGAGTSRGARRLREGLVVAEVGLACVMLVVGGLLIRSFQAVTAIDLGFESDQAVAWQLNPSVDFETQQMRADFYRALTARVADVPGVQEVGLIDALPLGRERTWGAQLPELVGSDAQGFSIFPHMIDSGYLEAMGIPIVAGRGFLPEDGLGNEEVMLINESGALRMFGDVDVVGRSLRAGWGEERRIIGVVADIRHSSPEMEAGNQAYFHFAQVPDYSTLDMVVRASAPLDRVTQAVSAALAEIDPSMPRRESWTLASTVDTVLSPRRFTLRILGAYGIVALLLAGLGIYGVLTQSVAERKPEIGIRMALGASGSDVLRSVMGRTLALTTAGIAIGAVMSLAGSRLLSSMLYGTSPTDPVAFVTMAVILLLVASAAGGIPALQASRIRGIRALRSE